MKWQIAILLFIAMPFAAAGGIAVSPAKLVFEGNEQRQLTLFNPSEEDLTFFVDAPAVLSFDQSTGIIKSGGFQKIIVQPQRQDSDAHSTKIYARLGMETEGVSILPGAVIGVDIKQLEQKDMTKFWGAALSTLIIVIGLTVYRAVR